MRGSASKTRTFSESAESSNFYPVTTLIIREGNGKPVPDAKAIARIADHYYGKA